MAKLKIPNILTVPISVAGVVALSFIIYFIAKWAGAYSPTAWGVFTTIGIFGAVIAFVWGRQIYWRITKKGDYEHLNKKDE